MTKTTAALIMSTLIAMTAIGGCGVRGDKASAVAHVSAEDAKDRVIRTQVHEAALLAEGAKTAVAEFHARQGYYPANNTSAGLAFASSIHGAYVNAVNVAGGRIAVTFGGPMADPAITGTVLEFSPSSDGAVIQWTCGTTTGSTVDAKYRPSACHQ